MLNANRLSAGLVAALLVAVAHTATAQTISTFDPAGNQPVGIGYGNDEVFIYDDFDSVIQVFDRSGNALRTIPSPGNSSNDYDIDFADAGLNLNGVAIPAGSLLVGNGDDSPTTLYALDSSDGTILSSLSLGTSTLVGVAFDSSSGLVYSLDWSADLVRVFDPSDGAALNSFPVAPAGSPAFDVFYGDLDIDGDGNLQIVTDVLEQTRVLSISGQYIQDFDLSLISPNSNLDLSGIAFDNVRGEAWVIGRSGTSFQLSGFPVQVPEPSSLLLLAVGCLAFVSRRLSL